jgi:DNA-directed RNA polymerase subunit beta'
LVGLKENVIMGRLIPAGTGMPAYGRTVVKVEGGVVEEEMEKEPMGQELVEGH